MGFAVIYVGGEVTMGRGKWCNTKEKRCGGHGGPFSVCEYVWDGCKDHGGSVDVGGRAKAAIGAVDKRGL